jgi:hypothetical protein
MSQDKPTKEATTETSADKIVQGYITMLNKLSEWTDKADDNAGPMFINGIKETEEFLLGLQKWSQEEIDLISRYVKRDLHDAATKMEQQNKNFKEWLDFDLQPIEEQLLSVFSNMADQTREELTHIEDMANEWHTGEVTSIGLLLCTRCGKKLHFHKAGHIPPCPACYHTKFKRMDD